MKIQLLCRKIHTHLHKEIKNENQFNKYKKDF